MLKKVLKEIKKFIYTKILRRKYYRSGHCLGCGKCCRKIYVKHARHVITEESELEKLRKLHPFYTYLEVVDKDETGLVFRCKNLDDETHRCKIHKKRPGICRRYPQEELYTMGGELSENCGYAFTPIVPFDEVFKKIIKKSKHS